MGAINGKCKALPGLPHSLEAFPEWALPSQGALLWECQQFLCIPYKPDIGKHEVLTYNWRQKCH